jgi:micrococcal nuclease
VTRQGLILLFLLLSAFSAVAQPSKNGKDSCIWYRVTRIVDGDTFWIDDGSPKGLKIRLIGIDAPESRNSGQKMKGFYGVESTEYITSLIGNRRVRLEYDVTRYDQYGRTLAYVYLDNGTFINADMVKNGFATVMTFPPNVRHVDTFVDLARKARKQNKGLWKNQ